MKSKILKSWRRRISGVGGFVLMAALACTAARAESAAEPRGGRVAWGRMITKSPYWNFHADRDPGLASFIRRETTLNIDPTWHTVDPAGTSKGVMSGIRKKDGRPVVALTGRAATSNVAGSSNLDLPVEPAERQTSMPGADRASDRKIPDS